MTARTPSDYLIPRAVFLELLEGHPDVRDFFTRAFVSTYLDKAFSDVHRTCLLDGSREELLFTTPVGQLALRAPVSAPAGISIREAAQIMSRRPSGSFFGFTIGFSPPDSA